MYDNADWCVMKCHGLAIGVCASAGGVEYAELVDEYTHTTMYTGLVEQLLFENAARVIREAQGVNKSMAPDQWSDKGCRALAKRAASSFEEPAMQHLHKIESLLV